MKNKKQTQNTSNANNAPDPNSNAITPVVMTGAQLAALTLPQKPIISSSITAANTPTGLVASTDQPVIFRKFQYTDLINNNNKFWEVRWWADGTMQTIYGRVGDAGQETTKLGMSESAVNAKISEKIRKGYAEIQLHVPTVEVVIEKENEDDGSNPGTALAVKRNIDQHVMSLIDIIFSEAGESISNYLAVGVDALRQSQIDHGKHLLLKAQGYMLQQDKTNLVTTVQDYFKTIPTILPRRIDVDAVVSTFVNSIAEQEDRLQQLETALVSHQVTKVDKGLFSKYDSLGAEIELIPGYDPRYETIHDYVQTTIRNHRGLSIKNIYKVRIPTERQAYLDDDFGMENIVHLFHGTNNKNIRHILRTGLIVPKVYTNGRRFGAGIYLADHSAKSLNYTSKVNRSAPTFLFITDAAIGNPHKRRDQDHRLVSAGDGYHSVWGTDSYGGLDEFIVYRTSQQTIRAIIEFNN